MSVRWLKLQFLNIQTWVWVWTCNLLIGSRVMCAVIPVMTLTSEMWYSSPDDDPSLHSLLTFTPLLKVTLYPVLCQSDTFSFISVNKFHLQVKLCFIKNYYHNEAILLSSQPCYLSTSHLLDKTRNDLRAEVFSKRDGSSNQLVHPD